MLCKLMYAYTCHYVTTLSSVDFHSHQVYECVYYTEGTGCLHINGTQYMYSPGTLIIIKPNMVHNEIHYTPTIPICLGYTALDSDARFDDDVTTIAAGNYPYIMESARTIVDEQIYKHEYYTELCGSLMNGIIILAKRIQRNLAPASLPMRSFAADLAQEWNLSSDEDVNAIWNTHLQEYNQYSYDQFRHAFKKRMNVSPTQFLMQLRLQKATCLLTDTAMNITDIALACGFSSCSYFTQQFHKALGLTPSQFRTRLSTSPNSLIEYKSKTTRKSKRMGDGSIEAKDSDNRQL